MKSAHAGMRISDAELLRPVPCTGGKYPPVVKPVQFYCFTSALPCFLAADFLAFFLAALAAWAGALALSPGFMGTAPTCEAAWAVKPTNVPATTKSEKR